MTSPPALYKRVFLAAILLCASCSACTPLKAATPSPPVPSPQTEQQQGIQFIAIGDTPYSADEEQQLRQEVTKAIQAANPPFLVLHGDLQGGGESCSDALLAKRKELFFSLLPGRVFYTPGDNEWADCDRSFLDAPVSELGRLDSIRRVFFTDPPTLPEDWQYARQPNFPENARWLYDGIFFMTVHLVSTNNGRVDIQLDDIEAALALVEARDQANRVWMQKSFAAALKTGAKAMVVITQADVTSPEAAGPCTATNRMNCDAFLNFRENLVRNARRFANWGEKPRPVLLLHGDTTPFCMDKNFGGTKAPNLWRLNAWGDFKVPADATLVTVQPGNLQQPFRAESLVGHEFTDEGCE
ncbi:MAG: hypothetical protein Q3M24_03855 [Candidatus Electrothrix aestuarii]|uniref:Calcineurin-like phosphoesterase n=1 Tax=Candidatus Electrothrix aestuarii TaxID=3062594 RepID=A0AAU8LY05_9BACT|nr:hypothetical protein [Candidatus Electrothrix aestuarii]